MPENTQLQGQTGGQPIGGQPQPAQAPVPGQLPAAQIQPVPPTPPPMPVAPMLPVQPAPAPIQPAPAVQPAPSPVQPAPAPVVQPAQPAVIPIMYAIPAQPVTQQAQPQPARPAMAPQTGQVARPGQGAQLRPGQPLKPGLSTRKPPNPKKLIYGCTGCFGAALLFFIIFVLIFAAQTTAAGDNPMARSLGVDTGTFINTLNTIVNMVFVGLEVLLFLLVIVGLFRFFMARKDDKDAKRKGLSLAGVTFLLLLFFGGIWIGIILFMDTKKVRGQSTKVSIGIITEPPVTLGLTAPITIKFDGTKLPIDSKTYDILSYLWSFGDGGTSTVATTSHTYKDKGSNNGRYDVTLQVVKRSKAKLEETTDTFTATVTIANVKLDAVISATPETGPAPLEVSFDASGSTAPAGEIVAYEWDFNNDNNFTDASGVTVTHTFEQLGTYTVNLRVTDNTNQFAVVSKEITVASPNIPTSVIEIPSESGEYFVGTKYRFLGDKSTSPNGEIQKYEWDFGDGSPKANTRQADHIYKSAGTYDVILKTTDGAGESGEATKQLKLQIKESAPIAVMNTVPPPAKEEDGFITGTIPFEVSFDAGKSTDPDNNIVDYKWDFDGDGKEDAAGAKASFVYKIEGTYNATLTVIDAENNESGATLVVKVQAQPLQARLVANPVEGVIPLIVTFDASSSTYQNGQIVSYEWDFGDGSPKRIDVSKVTYKYMKIGTFTAKVTAIASDNSKSTAETPVNVRPVALTSCFTPSTESGPAPLTVEFDTKCSTGTVAKTSWDFGDGETSKTRKPTHTFKTPGSYEVTLEVADNQNVLDTFSKSILVTGTL